MDIHGGIVEAGELPRNTAVREAREKDELEYDVISIIYETSKYDISKYEVFASLVYESTLIKESRITLDPEEHSEYQ